MVAGHQFKLDNTEVCIFKRACLVAIGDNTHTISRLIMRCLRGEIQSKKKGSITALSNIVDRSQLYDLTKQID